MTNSKDTSINKLASYLGLSLKAGKAVLGADNIYKTHPRVVIADTALAPNTRKKLDTHCNSLGIPIIYIKEPGKLIARPACKVIGIKEPNLAKAIINGIIPQG